MLRHVCLVRLLAVAVAVSGAGACSSSSSGPEEDLGDAVEGTRAPAEVPSRAGSTDPETGASSVAPGPAPLRERHEPLFVGRFDTTDPAGPRAAWPGARILARFEATTLSVKLSEFAEPWMEGAPSYWEYRIDRGDWIPLEMIPDNQEHDFPLASDLTPGPHQIELYKRSETQTGITQFRGFDFHNGISLPPPARQTRKIEVMGDSQSSGFGIEMLNAPNHDCPGADHGGRWQNFRKAWGGRLGERFDAEIHGIVFSGKGVIRNVWPTDADTLVRYYPRVNPNPALQNSNPPLFDMKSWIPDVVVMAQGAIDFNSGVAYDVFRSAYRTFIMETLRGRGPDAHIFMSVLGRGGRGPIPQIAQEIIAERAAAGDHKLHLFVANDYVWTEMVGCNGHGTPEWHQRIADELAAAIVKEVGWP